MPHKPPRPWARLSCLVVLCAAWNAVAIEGRVYTEEGVPIQGAYIGALSRDFGQLGQSLSGVDGGFRIDTTEQVGYLAVQPASVTGVSGIQTYRWQPRVYALPENEAGRSPGPIELRLPGCACLVLRARTPQGELMRWADYERQGVFGGVFAYVTNLDDEMIPAVCWPVHDEASRERGAPREAGLPALVVEPGQVCAVQLLFWEAPGCGKLLLRADNAGKGFTAPGQGEALIIDVERELARTAVVQFNNRLGVLHPMAALDAMRLAAALEKAELIADQNERAVTYTGILGEALRLRDDLELARAKESIPGMRMGDAVLRVSKGKKPVAGCSVKVALHKRDFQFGVFRSSAKDDKATAQARKAGFELATIMPAWGWTDTSARLDWTALERVLGIASLREQGYSIKAHGVVWLQGFGVLPERAWTMERQQVTAALLAQERALLNAWGNKIAIWEVMNEPATTNALGLSRRTVLDLVAASASAIKEKEGRSSLINSPHESDYGRKYLFFGLDNQPMDDYPLTYSDFLRRAEEAGALDQVDIIGIQHYPGAHYNEQTFGGQEAPAHTLSWFVDLLERYARFGKPLHITEFSVPASYGTGWKSGWWREPWTPETQATYVEAVVTLAYADPRVESLTWWDMTDETASVVTGGLYDTEDNPRPVLERLAALLQEWNLPAEITTDADGEARFHGHAGTYKVTVTTREGKPIKYETIHITAGEQTEAAIDMEAE